MKKVLIKTDQEIALMRESGRLLSQVFSMLDGFIGPGVRTIEIDQEVERYITEVLDARPASKGQYDYEYSLNASVNNVVCHGMPSTYILQKSDIVNIDITLEKNGYISDSSKMYTFENTSPKAKRLVKTTYEAMMKGIEAVKPGSRLGDIGHAIQQHAEKAGYSIVRDYCGHGIGKEMHEAPNVLHFGRPNTGLELIAGMTFTIEPMVNEGSPKTKTKKDGWTVITRDKKLSAQWEHTVLVTPNGAEILTLREEERH